MMARFERHRQWRAWLEWRGRDGDNIEVGERCGVTWSKYGQHG
jgi:hypothetical protein